jgi:putative DNA methylase
MHAQTKTTLIPLALQDAPALIETVFPAQKVSFEAQEERTAVQSQTLTGLGSYWKGRKPLILVRAIVLGSLLPPTDDAEADLAIFEKLMAFDDEGLARRALAANAFSATKLQEMIPISDPERYFGGRGWRRDVTDDDKLELYRQALATFASYEEKASVVQAPGRSRSGMALCAGMVRGESPLRPSGRDAQSLPELVEQLGILRYGHRPRVGDTFCGGGSIPFEAARVGCDAYASDLNPVACMLTWGGAEIIGAPSNGVRRFRKHSRHWRKLLMNVSRSWALSMMPRAIEPRLISGASKCVAQKPDGWCHCPRRGLFRRRAMPSLA